MLLGGKSERFERFPWSRATEGAQVLDYRAAHLSSPGIEIAGEKVEGERKVGDGEMYILLRRLP
jgi:hypothetical protein